MIKAMPLLAATMLLAACNTDLDRMIRQDLAADAYTTMDVESFAGRTDIILPNGKPRWPFFVKFAPSSTATQYFGPTIMNGSAIVRMMAVKQDDGSVRYALLASLKYAENSVRGYDQASTVSGDSLSLKRLRSEEEGCAGQTCYQTEVVQIEVPAEQFEKAKLRGLFATVSRTKRSGDADRAGYRSGTEAALSMLYGKQARPAGNENFDLEVPARYLVMFEDLVITN